MNELENRIWGNVSILSTASCVTLRVYPICGILYTPRLRTADFPHVCRKTWGNTAKHSKFGIVTFEVQKYDAGVATRAAILQTGVHEVPALGRLPQWGWGKKLFGGGVTSVAASRMCGGR